MSAAKAYRDAARALELFDWRDGEDPLPDREALDAAVLALMVEAVKGGARYKEPTVKAFCQALLKGEEP